MKQRKRIAAFALAAAMVFSTLPMNALAGESPPDAGGLCEHHPEHTADCGYTEGSEGTPCTHEHTEDCYTLVTECVHEHTEDCYPAESVSDNTATPSEPDEAEPTECTHECSEESGCITKKLDCKHEHDSECGYTEETPGTSCTYVCEICSPQDEENAGQKPDGGAQEQCSCITLCTEGNNNLDCLICGAEGADLSACKGKAGQEENCTCTVLCTEDAVNTDCPVCGAEGADLTLCVGKASSDVIDEAVTAVQEQIDALPTAEELRKMSKEEQREVYTKLQTAYDAYKALTDEQKDQITGAEIFDSLFGVFDELTAPAAEDAGFTITDNAGSEGTYTYEDGVLTVQDEADLTISTSGQTSHRIVVAEYAEATITLNGVHIVGESAISGADPFSAIDIANNASLLLQLADGSTNSLTGGNGETGDGAPGIHVPEEAELTILGSGSLTVAGGTGGYGGSGIGGTHVPGPNLKAETCGTVIILATGEISISGGESGPDSSPGNDIGGGKGPPEQAGGDGGGIRPTGDGNYVVWGEEALPEHPESYTIPEGATLTIPRDATLTIPLGVTLINNGTITGDGVIGGPGELTGSGVVTVDKNTFQKDSALTLTVEGATTVGGITSTVYGSTITLKAKVEQANIRTLSAGDYNTVTFYVGTDDSKKELGTEKVENNEASLTDVKIIAENGWKIGQNTVTAEFTGHSHLKPTTGTATLTVGKGPQLDPPDAPSDVSDITATSVTLTPVTGSDGKGNIQYGYTTGTMDRPYTWQSSPTFENLTPATAYTFYASYASNDFYLPSPSSTTGLKVITAPAADAVTFDYINETIQYADTIEVSPDQNFNASFHSGTSITSYIAGRMYMRVKAQGDGDTTLRGVTIIEVPLRPGSPKEPKVVNVSAAGQQDGKIIDLTPNADYQISTDNANWTDLKTDASGVISGLGSGTYWVRTKATSTQFAGAADSVTIGVGNVITIIPPTFEPVYVGYDQPAPKQITIQNSGDQDVTLTSLSKTAGETFTVSGIGVTNFVVPAGKSNTSFTVQPGEGWGVGEHTATITAEYGNGQTASATVRFVVEPRPYDEDDGDDNDATVTKRPDADEPNIPTTAQSEKVKTDGRGNVTITKPVVTAAIEAAKADVKKHGNRENGIVVEVPVETGKDLSGVQITLKADALDKLTASNVKRFTIDTGSMTDFGFTLDTLRELNRQTSGDILLRIKKTAVSSVGAKAAIGTRPACDISLWEVKNGRETQITNLNGRTISIAIPYTPAKGEQTGNLYAIYEDGSGTPQWITRSSYDADRKAVIFEMIQTGIYGVGYDTKIPAFTDIENHWAKDNILFVVSRGLLNGTGKTAFSPDTGMTRGMFVTALGRLAGINPDSYKTGNFTDVKADAYYAPYVNWAVQTGIVSGTTDTTFAPDSSINREQMAVILKNYAAKQGCTIPKTLEPVTFADNASISSWAKDAVKSMQQAGILAGRTNNRFDPAGTATRAEAATVLRRFVEIIIDPQTANGWMQNDSGEWSYYKNGELETMKRKEFGPALETPGTIRQNTARG